MALFCLFVKIFIRTCLLVSETEVLSFQVADNKPKIRRTSACVRFKIGRAEEFEEEIVADGLTISCARATVGAVIVSTKKSTTNLTPDSYVRQGVT